MLVLTRKVGEALNIGDEIKIVITEIKNKRIRIGIEAPKEIKIYRDEIYKQICEAETQQKTLEINKYNFTVADNKNNNDGENVIEKIIV
jgi:carbon storage regulator